MFGLKPKKAKIRKVKRVGVRGLSPDVFSGNGYEPTDKINHRLDQELADEGSG